MEKNLKEHLVNAIDKISSSLCTLNLIEKLEKYFDQLVLFNPSLALVKASDKQIIDRHILDSLRPLPFIKECVSEYFDFSSSLKNISVADLGSGNGMPGLVLASAVSDWKFSLIERMNRRAGFLRYVVSVTGNADHVKVVESDIENVAETFDLIVMRAFRPFEVVEKKIYSLCNKKALIFIWTKETEHGVVVKKV